MTMRRYRCLVVEDSKTMRSMLAESLGRIPGMEVVEAENGLAGIRALAAQRFDLVLTDVNMPVHWRWARTRTSKNRFRRHGSSAP